MALNVVKCGLYSHSLQVSELCIGVLVRIWNDIKQEGVRKIVYEWFTQNQIRDNIEPK